VDKLVASAKKALEKAMASLELVEESLNTDIETVSE